ncbi:MAG: hypothetical protein KIS96_00575 [Bauldia sp.]|nr:hypothetical protein [Bauldia sp.]
MIRRPTVRGRIAPVIAVVSLAGLLAACDTITYGTGVRPTEQTLRDITAVFDLGQGEDINYQPRPGLVAPPSNELPTPVSGQGGLEDNDATMAPLNSRAIPVNTTPTPTGPSMKLARACEDVAPIFRPPAGYCEMGPADQLSDRDRRGFLERVFGPATPPIQL